MIRLKISDYYRDPLIESMLFKLWKLMIDVQYEPILLKGVAHLGHIPLATIVYERIIPVFEKALGVYYSSSYYVAKRPQYKADTVFFERFCYDFVSLLGVNLLFVDIKNLDAIVRKVYSVCSYNFDFKVAKSDKPRFKEGGLRLVSLESVQPAFTMDDIIAS